jgi:membrane-anchored mycosin MYCP
MRRAGPLLVLLVLAAAVILGSPPHASAYAPTCGARSPNSPAPGAPTETPWAQDRLGTDRLGALATGRGVTVAVIDSGVDRANRTLGEVLGGGDLLDKAGDGLLDCVGHGTAVASLINGNDHGVAPKATVLSVRVTEQEEVDGSTVGRTAGSAALATAIRRAVDQGADVMNLSLVSYADNAQVRAAVADAVARDVVIVAAVGNRGDQGNPTPYPASYDGVIGVGAIGLDGRRLPTSQVGTYVDLVAPGAQILAAGQLHEGTSFAAPFVAAAAALVREYRPKLTAGQVVARLLATADPTPGEPNSPEYGHGLVNPYRALTDQLNPATGPTATSSPIPEWRPSRD